jgi:hypothetical protein
MLKRSSTPAVLLALLVLFVTLFAASSRATAAKTVAKTAAAPAPAAVTVPAPVKVDAPVPVTAALAAPAALPEAVPAVTSTPRATFAKDVKGLSPEVLAMALDAVECARARGVSGREDLLTVIDYSLPSTEPRLWVLDLERGEVLFHELVAHGAGTGDNYATRFSNVKDSRQTSLGLFRTAGTYQGGNGYSLKLEGLDKGINDRAEERYIVMHGAWYVSPEQIRSQGRLGRSWGCPALSQEIAPTVIDTIKGGSFIFSYSGKDESFQSFQKASSRTCGGDASPATGGISTVSLAR